MLSLGINPRVWQRKIRFEWLGTRGRRSSTPARSSKIVIGTISEFLKFVLLFGLSKTKISGIDYLGLGTLKTLGGLCWLSKFVPRKHLRQNTSADWQSFVRSSVRDMSATSWFYAADCRFHQPIH